MQKILKTFENPCFKVNIKRIKERKFKNFKNEKAVGCVKEIYHSYPKLHSQEKRV